MAIWTQPMSDTVTIKSVTFTNEPVNLSFCKGVETDENRIGNRYVYLLIFKGQDTVWTFNTKQERDDAYDSVKQLVNPVRV